MKNDEDGGTGQHLGYVVSKKKEQEQYRKRRNIRKLGENDQVRTQGMKMTNKSRTLSNHRFSAPSPDVCKIPGEKNTVNQKLIKQQLYRNLRSENFFSPLNAEK